MSLFGAVALKTAQGTAPIDLFLLTAARGIGPLWLENNTNGQ